MEEKRKTKSKWLAVICAWWGVQDLYLGYPKEFFKKLVAVCIVIGIPKVLYCNIRDLVHILTGRINTDANGIPLE